MHKTSTIYWKRLNDHERIDAAIRQGYETHKNDPGSRRTHFFGGRYENVYVERELIPALTELLDLLRPLAGEVLALPTEDLTEGFWFNEMHPGDATLPHGHDEIDELLSATYYLKVPENSGELVIQDGPARTRIEPAEGLVVFFDPGLVHEVTENRSRDTRLSLGINFGLRATSTAKTAL